MALAKKCYSPTCTVALSPYQDKCYSATCPDLERTLLALADPKERNALLELKDHQENVLGQLEALHTSVENLKNTVRNNVKDEELLCTFQDAHEVPSKLIRDIVILAPPSNPPASVIILKSFLQARFKVKASVHVHSDVNRINPKFMQLFKNEQNAIGSERRRNFDLGLTLIWKNTRFNQPQMIVNNKTPIIGEVNIGRYVKRLLQQEEVSEDLSGATRASVLDTLMDSVSYLLERQGTSNVDKEKAALVKSVASRLANQQWLSSQNSAGVEDALVWRFLCAQSNGLALPKTVAEWLARCAKTAPFQEATQLLL